MEPSSQEEVDLNTLIAAGSVTIGHKVSSLNRLSLDNDPSDPSNPVYSVANNNPTNTRTVRVLDALASLCVSCERSQVVSIALQLNFKTDILSITIAENTSVSDKTVTYLTELWAMLARLSKLYAENRQQGPNPTKWKGYLLKSPEALETLVNLDILVGDLAKHIYEFTRPKYERRISKWWGPLCDFADKFRSLKGKKLNRLEGTFERMMLSFVNCIEKLGSETKNWLEIMLFMDGAALMAKKILKDKYKCERWATSLAGNSKRCFFFLFPFCSNHLALGTNCASTNGNIASRTLLKYPWVTNCFKDQTETYSNSVEHSKNLPHTTATFTN